LFYAQEDHSAELEALKQESEMPLEDLLQSLPAEMLNSAAEDEEPTDRKVILFVLLIVNRFSSFSLSSYSWSGMSDMPRTTPHYTTPCDLECSSLFLSFSFSVFPSLSSAFLHWLSVSI